MEVSKNLRRKEVVPYIEIFEWIDAIYDEMYKRFHLGLDGIEQFILDQYDYWWAEDEASRLLCFVAMAYCEIRYANEMSEQFKWEMELDFKVWDSGAMNSLLEEDEKTLVHKHIAVIKRYLKNNPRK